MSRPKILGSKKKLEQKKNPSSPLKKSRIAKHDEDKENSDPNKLNLTRGHTYLPEKNISDESSSTKTLFDFSFPHFSVESVGNAMEDY